MRKRLILLAVLLVPLVTYSQGVPEACWQYQRILAAEAHTAFGLDAPVALLGAQIQQESGCRANAISRVGAQGLTQFMPATARDMALRYPKELGPVDPFNPRWAIGAQVRYMRDIVRTPWRTECDWWAAKLSAYNGGEGNLNRDVRICKAQPIDPIACEYCLPDVWWGNVENHSARAAWAFDENRGYPRRIMHVLMPRYVKAGYGLGVDCD